MNPQSTVFVAGANTLLGSALARKLQQRGFHRVVTEVDVALDLTSAGQVDQFLAERRPEYVFHAAGQSGGIADNQSRPAELCRNNLLVTTSVLEAARQYPVRRLLYLASSCCYPRLCPQPMRTEHLWTGPLEPTNEAYAAAKLAGIALCQAYSQQYGCDFVVGIPANSFGIEDDFNPQTAHVVPALIARMHQAKLASDPAVRIWGTGNPRREFLFADDVADAALFVIQMADVPPIINLAGGQDVSIRELAELVQDVVGYEGRLEFDPKQPDGMPLKMLDDAPLSALGWRPATGFRDAIQRTYEAFVGRSLQAR